MNYKIIFSHLLLGVYIHYLLLFHFLWTHIFPIIWIMHISVHIFFGSIIYLFFFFIIFEVLWMRLLIDSLHHLRSLYRMPLDLSVLVAYGVHLSLVAQHLLLETFRSQTLMTRSRVRSLLLLSKLWWPHDSLEVALRRLGIESSP